MISFLEHGNYHIKVKMYVKNKEQAYLLLNQKLIVKVEEYF